MDCGRYARIGNSRAMKTISMIVAMGPNNEIGRNNELIYSLPEDMAHFKEFTMGKSVIMGRKTYESIGRLLHGRQNIVMTRDKKWDNEHHSFVASDFLDAKCQAINDIVVIGGTQIYKIAMPHVHEIIVSHVNEPVPDADAFFPKIPSNFLPVLDGMKTFPDFTITKYVDREIIGKYLHI